MPPPPRPNPPPHTIRIAYSGIVQNARWANIFWARNGKQSPPGASELQGLAQNFYTQFVDQFLHVMTNLATLQGCQILYYGDQSITGAGYVANTNGTHLGAASLPASVAAGITWSINERYRGGHPRTYIAGMTQDRLLDNQNWTPEFQGELRTQADQFHALMNTLTSANVSDLHLGVVSFVLRKAWRTPPVFRDFTPGAAIVDKRIDTQRRRLGKDVKS